MTASLTFPRLKLTEQNTAANGDSNYLAKDFFGLNHKLTEENTKNTRDRLADRSYIDLLRYQGGGIDLHAVSAATQYSFRILFDDVRKDLTVNITGLLAHMLLVMPRLLIQDHNNY